MSSILNDVKNSLGIVAEDDSFDSVLVMHINTFLNYLTQFGVGPIEGFAITGPTDEWDSFFTETNLNSVKSYLYLRVRVVFDPPTTGFTQQSFDRQIEELTFRILSETDY